MASTLKAPVPEIAVLDTLREFTAVPVSVPPDTLPPLTDPPVNEPPEMVAVLKVVEVMVAPFNVPPIVALLVMATAVPAALKVLVPVVKVLAWLR